MVERVDFGQPGFRVSRLSIGTGTHGFGGRSEQTRLGVKGLANLLRQGYERGINFWDTADGYGSHPHVARALQDIPREKVVIATKTMSRSKSAVAHDIERFRRELNTDVLDIVLMHYLTQPDWTTRFSGAIDALARAKDRGQVRAIGVSCHNFDALCAAAASQWVDVVLVRINYAGVNMDAAPSKVVPVIARMYDAGKAIYGMKALGCGQLANDPHKAISYVLGLGTVHAITIGTSHIEHLHENVQLVQEIGAQYPIA